VTTLYRDSALYGRCGEEAADTLTPVLAETLLSPLPVRGAAMKKCS